MLKDSIQTRVLTFYIAKHFIIPIETLLIGQHQLWNDVQLRIATVTHFSWYFAANTTVF